MQVRIVTERNAVILEHSQEGNGHEQIFSRQVSSNTKAGQCNFQIIDTGGCLLWIGEFIIAEKFTIHARQKDEGLQMLISWPQEPGNNFASIFGNTLLLFHIGCSIKSGGSNSLSCDGGKGQLVLLNYQGEMEKIKNSTGISTRFPKGYQEPTYRMDSHKASVVQHILYYPAAVHFRQYYLRIKTEELYLLLLQDYAGEKNKTSLPSGILEKLVTAETMIRENPEEHYSIASLAKTLHLNTANLQRYFKAYYGCTLHQYILIVKMEAAVHLITHTGKSFKEISFDLGFKSDANFSEAFKKHFGYPPGQLRKKNSSNL